MTLDRRAAADALARAAFAAELLDDPFIDARAATSLAWAVRSADGDTEALFASGALERLDGMNAPLWAIVDDALHGRSSPLVDDLERMLPRGLRELAHIKGLGPKRVRALWKDLDVASLADLEYACRENRLLSLKGFGPKTQTSVLEQIERLRAEAGWMRQDDARHRAAEMEQLLLQEDATARVVVAGEIRRGCELVGAVALVALIDEQRAAAALGRADETPDSIERITVAGGVRLSRRVGAHLVTVRVCANESQMGVAIVEETGADGHVEALRLRAAQRGTSLDAIASTDEAGVYAALGLVPTAPERREAGVPLVEVGRAAPRLVERADLRGALHNHTDASDGAATLEALRHAASRCGLSYLGISDHSQSASYAHGLDAARLAQQRARIDELNREGHACTLLSGVESDVLRDGALDYPDDVLHGLDVVVASVHNRFGQRREAMTARLVRAARHPSTDVLGHPTGRLLLGRAAAELDIDVLLCACAEAGCAVELNANPARLDLNEQHLAAAKERGVLVSIAADAHAESELDALSFGVAIARRAGLGPEHVLNTRGLADLREWLRARRARNGAS